MLAGPAHLPVQTGGASTALPFGNGVLDILRGLRLHGKTRELHGYDSSLHARSPHPPASAYLQLGPQTRVIPRPLPPAGGIDHIPHGLKLRDIEHGYTRDLNGFDSSLHARSPHPYAPQVHIYQFA